MDELKEKLENIEVLLQANIAKMNKIVAEANDPEKRQKEAEILINAANSINTTTETIKGLILSEKALIDNFKPTVEVKHTHLNLTVNNPLAWVLGAIAAILISFAVSYWMYYKWQEEKSLKEHYLQLSNIKDDNYMKYKYLLLFGERPIVQYLKEFDKDYQKNWKIYNKQVIKRENELDEAERARKEAELRAAEARKLQQYADSLQNSK